MDCGTGFDDFSERAHRDWFAQNPPSDAITSEQFANRQRLDQAMEAAGFVGLASEWWHFEWGTRLWSAVSGNDPVLVERLELPGP